MPIVDTHQHLWDLNRFRLPWLASAPALQRSFLTHDYLVATEGLDVVKAIYMEVDVAPDQQAAEAEAVIDLCARDDTPTVAAVISGQLVSAGFEDYIRHYAASPAIKGVRQVLHVPEAPPGLCLASSFVRNVQLLGELGLCFDLCMRPGELADAVVLVEQCPGTRFVVDHCGNPDPYVVNGSEEAALDQPFAHTRQQWLDDMAALAARPNTICKISGIIARTRPGWTAADLAPTINHCLDVFGSERVVFGGDWPVCTLGANTSYRTWLQALLQIIAGRSQVEQRRLLFDNAMTFYELA